MPIGCRADGILDESKYSKPMPWIGIYIAVASAACAAAMAADIFHGLRHKKLWFPCKFFSLNATTLALMAVATKLSVDLNSSMPRHGDQLAKLSSGAFICTVMSNFMPSLGAMKPTELAMNLMAWGIFVITVVVNIGIQLGTGVIFAFWEEHAAIVFVMIILLLLLVSSALSIPTTKSYFDLNYSKKYNKLAQKKCVGHQERIGKFRPSLLERLRDDLMTYWMMALTCSPQFVVGRSVMCTASGAFCLLSMVVYAEAILRSYLLHRTFKFCSGESDYKWSTGLILVTQTIAILIGTIAPASRWIMAIEFQCPKKLNNACHNKLKVEDYWIQSLVQCKESPLDLRKRGRRVRKIAHSAKDRVLDFCIGMQRGIVRMSKLVRLVSLFWVRWLLIGIKTIIQCCHDETEMESRGSCSSSMPEDLRSYILHLEGEEALIDYMMSCHFDASEHWIKMGKKKEPKNLTELLRNWTPEHGFLEVNRFDSDLVPSLDCEKEPPNCWALPVVTLASIATAVSSSETDHSLREQLMKSVEEAMVYVRFLEERLDRDGILTNLRKAAQMVWVRVDLHHKWLDLDLSKMVEKGTPENILKSLSAEAKQRYIQYKNKDVTISLAETPLKWPAKMLAANSMYRICQSLLLLTTENQELQNSNMIMLERLSQMIRGIVGACLTNLPHVICTLCHQSSIEERGKSVRLAITLLGKVGKILEIVSRKPLPSGSSADRRLAHIDDWRALSKEKGNQLWNSCPAQKNNAPRGCSSGLYITVE